MSKSEVINAVMDSALAVFSQHGFEGASLRDIAGRATVPLSSIHRYFSSKADLYVEVMHQVWGQIAAEREALLSAALARAGPGTPDLSAILHALIHPIVIRAVGDQNGLPMVHMLGNSVLVRRQLGVEGEIRGYTEFSSRWVHAILLACPGATMTRAIWAYSFAVGALYNWNLLDHLYDSVLKPDEELSGAQISAMLVVFCTQGIRASIQTPDSL